LGDGSGHHGITALVPRVALPLVVRQHEGFDSLSSRLEGPAETRPGFGLVG
jgi:hypothetical protein